MDEDDNDHFQPQMMIDVWWKTINCGWKWSTFEPSKSIQILWLIMMFGEFFVENREKLKIWS